MRNHTPTLIGIGLRRQDDESKPSSIITGSLKSTVVTPQNKSVSFISHFYHWVTQLLYISKQTLRIQKIIQ